jgi:hypothetical protein
MKMVPKNPTVVHVPYLRGGKEYIISSSNGSKKRVKTEEGWRKVRSFSARCLNPLTRGGLLTFKSYAGANDVVINLHRS